MSEHTVTKNAQISINTCFLILHQPSENNYTIPNTSEATAQHETSLNREEELACMMGKEACTLLAVLTCVATRTEMPLTRRG